MSNSLCSFRALFRSVLLFIIGTVLLTDGFADSVYSRVYGEMASHPNRIAGSEALESSFDVLEKELKAAGLNPRYQTFNTLVQKTEKCEMTYAGKKVSGVLMIDNGPAPFVLDRPLEGPLVYAGSGNIHDLDGSDIKGAIAVVDLARSNVRIDDVFMHGAKAVVLVGDDSVSQWQIARTAYRAISLIPRLYIDRENAEKFGFLSADGSRTATIDARAVLVDVPAKNLWVELPYKEGWTGNLDGEEVLVLSARMDTYGFTPDYCPDLRYAANAALLAETVCRIAESGEPLNRRVIAVFFGSHYAGQDGARFFYHAVDMADKRANGLDLTERGASYEHELEVTETLLRLARGENIITAPRTQEIRELQQRLKREIISAVGKQRGPTGRMRAELSDLTKGYEGGNSAVDARISVLKEQIEAADSVRNKWNELRRQLVNCEFEDTPENVSVYNEMMSGVIADLELRKREITEQIANNKTWVELSDYFFKRNLVGHFDFDFASAEDPWMFSVINASGLYRNAAIDIGSYYRYFHIFSEIYYGDDGESGISNGKNWKARLYKPALNPTYKPYSLSVPNQRVVPSVLGVGLGYAGFQMMTVGNNLAHDALPFGDNYNLEPLTGQMVDFCRELGNSVLLSIRRVYQRESMEKRYLYEVNGDYSWKGVNFQNYAHGSTDNEGLPDNSILQFTGIKMADPVCGMSHMPRSRILANGFVYMPYVSRNTAVSTQTANTIGIGYDENGAFERISVGTDSAGIVATPIHMFYAYGGISFSNGYPPDPIGGDMYEPKIMIASKDAIHKTCGSYGLETNKKSEFFADRPDPIKRIGSNGEMILGSKLLEDASPSEMLKAAMGEGVPLESSDMLSFDGIAQGANDVHVLNEIRLRVLRERNIVCDDLERLHADAKDHIEEAKELSARKEWSLARAHQVFATCIEGRVYRPLRGVTEDLVQAVVLLLLLNIPFAFAMERLIFGFTSIYKQILGFCGFFIATFGILYFTHPAFALASAPVVIFLAFVIILLSVVTAAIMMGKIKMEIKAIQGLASTVHGMENDNSTMLSAVLIGIAGMRNRPLKTFLTCTTVVLLTFTILVFASFTSQQGVVESYLGRGQGENRIELHRLSLLRIDRTLVESIEDLYSDNFHVFRRGGLFRDLTRGNDVGATPLTAERIIYCPRNGNSVELSAVMGLDPGEFDYSAQFRSVIPGFSDEVEEGTHPMYLPEIIAKNLEVNVGDEIRMNGVSFVYKGIFDARALQGISTLDDMRVLLPDFQATMRSSGSSATGAAAQTTLEDIPSGSFEWFSSEMIAITRMSDLIDLFPTDVIINFMTLYPQSDSLEPETYARSLATVFQGTVHVKSSEGVRRMFFTKAVEGSGFADVIVPLLLGGLIVFSSLMGSIVDREREIFTYSALGLSPPNVGALFFAESAVYSVIGGMGGYLLSQVVAKVFSVLGRMGVMTPPEMNFSSLTSVCTILIVMAVVMLSTIFPAIRASRSANPGVARRWSMPKPDGNEMKFVFPFTVSEVDFAGILSFIKEHFNNHSDATLGSFAARDVKLFKIPGGKGSRGEDALGIEADISLAPFDLGIFQKFKMYSNEFEIKGIDEVVVELRRVGGTPTSWVRSNRAFADELRKQFLLWRSLPIETIEYYRKQTREELSISDASLKC